MAPEVACHRQVYYKKIKKRKMGYTLPEVMVASILFLIIVGVISISLVTGFRSFKIEETEIPQVRSVRSSLNYMSQILRGTGTIYNEANLKTQSGANEIIFEYNGKVSSLRYNSSKKEIEYFEYQDYETPNQKITPDSLKVISLNMKNIQNLTFKIENVTKPKLITIEVSSIPADPAGVIFNAKTKVLLK